MTKAPDQLSEVLFVRVDRATRERLEDVADVAMLEHAAPWGITRQKAIAMGYEIEFAAAICP